jgi:hypothetical protein
MMSVCPDSSDNSKKREEKAASSPLRRWKRARSGGWGVIVFRLR